MGAEAETSSRIVAALAEYIQCNARSIKPTDRLRDDLGLDSMATIELLYKIEEAFDLQIPDRDLSGLRTVEDVVQYVQQKMPPVVRPSPHRARASRRSGKRKNPSSRS